MGLIQKFDVTHSPVGLWQFGGDLTDSSGNGFTLTVETGTARFTNTMGLVGLVISATTLFRNNFEASLNITGNLTIEMLLALQSYTTGRTLVSHSASGDASSVSNLAYGVSITTGPALTFKSESGTGVDASYSINDLPPRTLCHFAVTRSTNVIQFYLNGQTMGAASSALTAPTGGTSGRFRVGMVADTTENAPDCSIFSLKVVNSALSAAQIAAEYNRTLGTFFGGV